MKGLDREMIRLLEQSMVKKDEFSNAEPPTAKNLMKNAFLMKRTGQARRQHAVKARKTLCKNFLVEMFLQKSLCEWR